MLFEIFLVLFVGILLGILFGLLPGVHPNLIILFIPLLASLNLEPQLLLALIVSVAVTNSILSFLPSILLGVPDSGNELSILPGHRMLLNGYGYQAVKLAITGAIGAVILCAVLFPVFVFAIPFLFDNIGGYVYLLLIAVAALMILTEVGAKRLVALALFLSAGFIGVISPQMPVDNTLILFPIFSGFFGISALALQVRSQVEIPRQEKEEMYVSKGLINRSVISGTLAGILSGLLPGVGASEVATLASIGKNEQSFLVKIGAITTANIILSILGLWLIDKSRSGLAVVIEQLVRVELEEVLMIIAVTLIAGGTAVICAITLARKSIGALKNFDYTNLAYAVFIFISLLTYIFAGMYGILLLITCSGLGILANLSNVKRGVLMGVLMLPTIMFYLQTA